MLHIPAHYLPRSSILSYGTILHPPPLPPTKLQGLGTGEARFISMKVHKGVPHVAFADAGKGNRASVVKYA